jgi:predicted phosphodiesterase
MTERLAVITDVHANLPALTAALAAVEALGCDAIACLGDAIGIGPYPAECLDVLLDTPNVRFVMGNHDAWFATGLPHPRPPWMSEGEERHHRWTHAQLSDARRTAITCWPFVDALAVGRARVGLLYYALDPTGRGFAPIRVDPTTADLDALFAPYPADLVCYGHHHPAADATGRTRYVNPGALDCSHDALARFLVVETDGDGCRVAFHAVPYDRTGLIRAFAERGVPERAVILEAFFGIQTP